MIFDHLALLQKFSLPAPFVLPPLPIQTNRHPFQERQVQSLALIGLEIEAHLDF
jgi:hypothetical protein